MGRLPRNTANITREQKMKNFTAVIILLLAGSGQAQFNFTLGQLLGAVSRPRTSNNNDQQNTNNPLQDLIGQILDNTEVSIGQDGIKLKAGTTSACPPLLGVAPPPGCDKTFVEGDIPCWDDTDCPSPGTCQNNICDLYVSSGCSQDTPCKSAAAPLSYTSPISSQSTRI